MIRLGRRQMARPEWPSTGANLGGELPFLDSLEAERVASEGPHATTRRD